ncbi:pentapeptide repeat-containing protein [Actinomadura vinacea]|uniref:Pentapeptide repeat-containing protein n=1 Tax=Actinomadura vinacea TaxID=115336 RepID=A0ABP5VVI0_9ACTN
MTGPGRRTGRSKASRPAVPGTLDELPFAERLVPHDGVWRPDGDHDTVRFGAVGVPDVDAPGSRFLDCAFTGTALEGGGLRRARFINVWAHELRLVGTDLAGTEWQDTALLGSVAAAAAFSGARLSRVTFRGCKLDGINFRDAELTDVTFEDCLLREVDFGGAALTRTGFPGSRLARTTLVGARLEQADLRGAELGITIEPGSLRGAIVSPEQLQDLAPLLAETLGITVEDPAPRP